MISGSIEMNTTHPPATQNTTHHSTTDGDECNDWTKVYMSLNCTLIILILGGNFYILKTLNPFNSRNRTRRRNIDLFIVYLACFDLLTTFIVIVDVYEQWTCYASWPFSSFGCKIVYPCFHISLSMTVCILGIMSIDRCRSLTQPLKKKFSRNSIHAAVFVCFAITTAFQWYQFQELNITPVEKSCGTNRTALIYALPRLFSIFFRNGLFLIVFTVSTAMICNTLRKSSFKSTKYGSSHKVITMLITMGVVFIILVIPYDIYDSIMLITRIVPGYQPVEFT